MIIKSPGFTSLDFRAVLSTISYEDGANGCQPGSIHSTIAECSGCLL